jgi:hypothetical protein
VFRSSSYDPSEQCLDKSAMNLDPFSPELHFALGNALVLPCWLALAV